VPLLPVAGVDSAIAADTEGMGHDTSHRLPLGQ